MSRLSDLSSPRRWNLSLTLGLTVLGAAGCGGDTTAPKIKPNDPSATYTVSAPPPKSASGKESRASKGTMSVRELRAYRRSQEAAKP